jgi:hypothetical protein
VLEVKTIQKSLDSHAINGGISAARIHAWQLLLAKPVAPGGAFDGAQPERFAFDLAGDFSRTMQIFLDRQSIVAPVLLYANVAGPLPACCLIISLTPDRVQI